MTRRLVCLALFAVVLGGLTPPARLGAQQGALSPDKALAAMKPLDGFQVELFASEPMLFNPTSIDVDHKGRVWVAEAVNYRRKGFGRPIIRKEGDRIQVLIDTNGDGKADEAKTFYQGADLYGPLSVCVIPQANPDRKVGESLRVLVAQSPDILEFWDKDGDLKADGPPKKFLSGFGGFDHDHGVHGLSVGPDGKLYFTVGDSGVTGLQSSDGKGRKWVSNPVDCHKGTVWRCDLDGTNLELIAHNFRNNYEACVDSFGEIWLSDNDDDGNQQTRICFVMPGGDYGYGPRGQGESHWHEEKPGVVHKVLRTGFGSPTGITFYEGSLLPEKYRGALLHCDAGPREVRAFFRKPKGAGYELDKEIILTSTDTWFRPSDVCVAPDGSIFVSDWYDKGVGGHGMNDPQDGRIYRLTPKGHKGYKVPEVKMATAGDLRAALGSPCLATRALAIAEIPKDGRFQTDILVGATPPTDPREAKARVLWQLFRVWRGEKPHDSLAKFSRELLEGKDEEFARLAVRAQELFEKKYAAEFYSSDWVKELASKGAATRRELLLNTRNAPASKAIPLFYALAKLYDGEDHFYRAALNIACGLDPKRRDVILAEFDTHFPEWNDKVAELVWELRPWSSLPRLEKLVADAKLTAAQKARIVEILGVYDDPAAGITLLAVLKSDASADLKTKAIASLKQGLPTKWRPLLTGKELAAAVDDLLKNPKAAATGLQLVSAAGLVDRIDSVAKLAADEQAAADTRKEAVRALGKLRSVKSVEALKAIATAETRDPAPALGVEAVNALAALIPEPPKSKDTISRQAQAVLESMVLGKGPSVELKRVTVGALAGTLTGSRWLIAIKERGGLPPELDADTGRLLRNSPFQDVKTRAAVVFPAPGKLNPKALPAVAELAKRTGNVERGRKVWTDSLAGAAQCAKCHMVRGVGGQVGPDLSMIGKKGGAANILESILDPSKAIADQYLQHSVTTVAGVTVSGLLVSDTPQAITLRDANGKDVVIAKADIEGAVRKLKVSIMPQDIVAALSEDELIDLTAYLTTLQTAAYTPDTFKIAGPFGTDKPNDIGTAQNPEIAGVNLQAVYFTKSGRLGWRSIRPDGKGYFDLAGFHGTAGNNSASYLYTEVESPADQDAEVSLGTDDGAKLWVNGKEVWTFDGTRAAAPGQDTVKVKLVKGKNTVLLKVANGNNPHGFYFTLLSKDEVKPVALK